jgi:hypothetical protein
LKKPQVLIGLLAALGTAIGVLVAVVGMPYGRLNYTAFAGLYHNGTPAAGTPATFHLALDCDTVTPGVQDNCNVIAGTPTVVIDVTISQETGAAADVSSFNFKVKSEQLKFDPIDMNANPGDTNDNPDANEAFLATGGTWACSPPAPDNDDDASVSVGSSFISCFNSDAMASALFPSGVHTVIADVSYNVLAVAGQSGLFTSDEVNVTDLAGVELIACPDNIAVGTPCFPATINIVNAPTNTPVPPTNTPLPATATNTATPVPAGGGMFKDPIESAADEDGDNIANIWLCLPDTNVGNDPDCDGPGEGSLEVIEYIFNIQTGDQNGDTLPDGLGAYEFQIKFDHKVIAFVIPEDIIFSATGAGAARGPADCSFSLVGENDIRFGCVTTGDLPPGPNGPGPFELARITLIPESDLVNIISPGNDNGIVTVLLDENCEAADVFGHPVAGSVNGGLLPTCADLAVTVRILEGDMDLDCDVDVADQQAIAMRYGSYFGNLHYSKWYDLEPWFKDLDIDIKDLQKVFGRDGSTCQNPIPAQPPAAGLSVGPL